MAKLLVVDDEVGIRELLSEILADEGHAVVAAGSAEEARTAIARQNFDLVLLDIWMPDTDGVTFLKELSSQHAIDCPVIMMSGHATIDTAVEATKFGAADFLEKPISMKRLLSSVNAALQARETEDSGPMIGAKTPEKPRTAPAKAEIFKAGGALLETIPFTLPLREARDRFERLYLSILLEEEGGSMSRVATRAGLERTHLYRKIKQLEVTPPAKAQKD